MLGHFSTDIVLIFAGQLGVDLVPSQLLSISPGYRKVVVSSVMKFGVWWVINSSIFDRSVEMACLLVIQINIQAM